MPQTLDLAEIRRRFPTSRGGSTVSKLCPLREAIERHVKRGMTLHFGYSEGRPMAISNELVRCFDRQNPEFTIVGSGLVSNQAALVSRGLVRRVEVSFLGENFPTPTPNRVLQAAINEGQVEVENQSLLALYQRLAAGALGVPFYPTRSWADSSLEANESYARVKDPFGDEDVGVLRALVPDISFVHGLAADQEGNILLSPPFGEAEVAAFASRLGVIATVEKIVSRDEIMANAALMKVPSHRVLSVSEAPLGSHPYGIFTPAGLEVEDYVEDRNFFVELRGATGRKSDFDAWTDKWILGVADHHEYLSKLGHERIKHLMRSASGNAWEQDFTPEQVDRIVSAKGYSPAERMVVSAAGFLREKVLSHGYGIIEAGVGYANLAAWLAAPKLQCEDGRDVELVAEIGLYGCSPRPGETFIFSHRNLPTAKGLTNVESLLGYYVAGAHNRCIAIIGAGQIDLHGNINSTYAADGRFLVGSGGANDITSAATEVIAVTQQRPGRLVRKLPYVTSVGTNITTLVTDLGLFEKQNGELVLTRYFGVDENAALEEIRKSCGWDLKIAQTVRRDAEPADDDLVRLRLFDLRNDFFDHV